MSVEDEIRSVMIRWNKAVAEGNLAELSQIISHDDKAVLISRGKTYVGYNTIINQFERWFEDRRVHLTSKEMIIGHSGNVAWVTDDQHGKTVDLRGKLLRESPILKLTSVLVKKNDKWMFVQFHHSVPPDEKSRG